MRKIKKGKVNKAVMAAVARNYDRLKRLCAVGGHGIYGGEGFEDIFQDTVLYVIQDSASATLQSDDQIVEHFLYRFNMIKFQRINDDKARREVEYADYKQRQEKDGSEG